MQPTSNLRKKVTTLLSLTVFLSIFTIHLGAQSEDSSDGLTEKSGHHRSSTLPAILETHEGALFTVNDLEHCPQTIPSNSYLLATAFFNSFDNAISHVLWLRRYGFHANFLHTSCQPCDVAGDLFVVTISNPVTEKALLYHKMGLVREKAKHHGINLKTTRIVHYK